MTGRILIIAVTMLFLYNCTTVNDNMPGGRFTVTAYQGLYLREKAFDGKVITLIPHHQEVTVLEKKDYYIDYSGYTTWYKVRYGAIEGWVSGNYLRKSIPADKKVKVTGSGIGPLKLGDSYNDFVKFFKPTKIDKGKDGEWHLWQGDSYIISIYDRPILHDDKTHGFVMGTPLLGEKKVLWVELHSEMFLFGNDIRINSSIDELLAEYPQKEIHYSQMTGNSYFDISPFRDYQKGFKEVIFEVRPLTGDSIITDKNFKYDDKERTNKFNKKGKVITIFLK